MRRSSWFALSISVWLLAPTVIPGVVLALPLFSRATQEPCASCHVEAPRLTAYGMEFLRAGFQSRDSAAAPCPAHTLSVSLGASLGYAYSGNDGSEAGQARLESGRLDVDVAGSPLRNLGVRYAGEYRAASGAFETRSAWVRAGDEVNVRAGRFELEAPYLSESRRTTEQPYLSPVTLVAQGLELNGERATWTWAIARVESHRHEPGVPKAEAAEQFLGRFEDLTFSIMRGTGADRIAGRMLFDRQDSNLPQHAWLQHLQAEGSALVTAGALAIVPAYAFDRFDDRPAAGLHERHQYALLELFCPLGSARRWDLTARGEHEYVTANGLTREQDRNLEVLSCGYSPSPRLRLAAEGSHAGDNVGGPRLRRIGLNVSLRL